MAELRALPGIGARALELVILTAARSGEVPGARWPEFDQEAAILAVPASRMKHGRLDRLPLASAAVTLLRQLRGTRTDDKALVFPGGKLDRTSSGMALTMTVRGMNETAGEDSPRWRDIAGRAIVQ